MEKKKAVWLCLIIILAFFLRFYKLGSNPPSLTWDETAWGYNAYSLGLNGKDEFGKFLPLDYLESFGDFKPPVYAYLTILPVKIFGLNEFSSRFASAFFGSLTVILTYFLVREIFYTKGQKDNTVEYIALFSSLFLSISPWHLNLSRAAFEANVATFFIVLGVFLFLKAVNKRSGYLIFSSVSFVLSMYTFNTARIVAPFLALFLFIIFSKKIINDKKTLLVVIIIAFILSLPFIKFMMTPQAKLRFNEVNIFSNLDVIKKTNQEMENDKLGKEGSIPVWSKIIHNRRLAFFLEYSKHYLDHFNPAFLFISGDVNPKFSTRDTGILYLWDLPFFIAGLIFLFKKKSGYYFILPIWLLIGIIPAATARETPHALRIETTIPTFQVISAIGFVGLIALIRAGFKRNIMVGILLFLLLINCLYYLHGYYVHYPKEFSGEWQYGYREAIYDAKRRQNNFDNIVMTEDLGRPYIYFLFYEKTTPLYFQQTAIVEREVFGFVHVKSFGKYFFGKDLNEFRKLPGKTLFIDRANNTPSEAKILNKVNLLNGEPTLVSYTL